MPRRLLSAGATARETKVEAMHTISVNGETLHYQREGSGPPLVMIHSLGTNSYMWSRQFHHWKDRFTCVAFDARGHGRSTNNGGVTIKAVAADLHAALRQLGLLPAHLIGISMGALIAARIHEIEAGAVLSIVYADSFAHLSGGGEDRIRTIEKKLGAMSMEEYAAEYASNTLLESTPAPEYQALIDAIAGVTPEAYLQTARSIFGEDVSGCLRKVKAPLLALAGDSDQRSPIEKAREVSGLVPGSAVLEVRRAGHLANIDNPEGFQAAVDSFLARAAARRAMPGAGGAGAVRRSDGAA